MSLVVISYHTKYDITKVLPTLACKDAIIPSKDKEIDCTGGD